MGLSVYVAAGIRVGQEMSREEIKKLFQRRTDSKKHVTRRSVFLAVRPRSEQELRRRLAQKKYPEDIITQVIARLGDVKLVDDRDFAKFWVETREGFKPRSKRALQYELRQKGVANEEITRGSKRWTKATAPIAPPIPRHLRFQSLDAKAFREKLSGFLAGARV